MEQINHLQRKLKKCILYSAQILKKPTLVDVIKYCRLLPLNFVYSPEYSFPTISAKYIKRWADQYGNLLELHKHKNEYEIIYFSSKVNREPLYNRDLYANLPIHEIKKFAKRMFFLTGKDIDYNDDYYVLSFLGIDDILRTYVYIYGEWKFYPSMCLGVNVLNQISKSKNKTSFFCLTIQKRVVYECSEQNSWISEYPMNDEFKSLLNKHKIVADVMKL